MTTKIMRVWEKDGVIWTGDFDDLLESCGDLPDATLRELGRMRPGECLGVNGFMVERMKDEPVPLLGKEEDDGLDGARGRLAHAVTVMVTATTAVKGALVDLGAGDVGRLREVVEAAANELLAVGDDLADVEVEG